MYLFFFLFYFPRYGTRHHCAMRCFVLGHVIDNGVSESQSNLEKYAIRAIFDAFIFTNRVEDVKKDALMRKENFDYFFGFFGFINESILSESSDIKFVRSMPIITLTSPFRKIALIFHFLTVHPELFESIPFYDKVRRYVGDPLIYRIVTSIFHFKRPRDFFNSLILVKKREITFVMLEEQDYFFELINDMIAYFHRKQIIETLCNRYHVNYIE